MKNYLCKKALYLEIENFFKEKLFEIIILILLKKVQLSTNVKMVLKSVSQWQV
jgi:hypothetical protein